MKGYLYIGFLLLWSSIAIGQIKKGQSSISYISLTDSTLINTINKVVDAATNVESTDNLFRKGFGYISVHVTKYTQKDTLRVYSIAPSLFSIREESSNNLYPDYYSIINNRLVVIYLDGLRQFANMEYSDKAKQQIRSIVNGTLEKTKKVTFCDNNEKESFTDKHFRIDHLLWGSYTVYIIKGKNPVIKETE